MITAMVGVMKLLWLMSWDNYNCTIIITIVVAMVVAMVTTMKLL